MSVNVAPPQGQAGFDIHADQRGRIIGTSVAIFVLTDVFVGLRLLSRKLARAGYWVSEKADLGLIAHEFMLWNPKRDSRYGNADVCESRCLVG